MEIAKLKHQITKLTTENKRLTTKFMKIKTTITLVMISSHFAKSPSMAAFMLMQFNRYDNLHSNAHYSPLEQTICISILHSCKQNGYRQICLILLAKGQHFCAYLFSHLIFQNTAKSCWSMQKMRNVSAKDRQLVIPLRHHILTTLCMKTCCSGPVQFPSLRATEPPKR